MTDQAKRVRNYIPLIDGGQRCELYPPVGGIEHNGFEYMDFNRSHLKIRNVETEVEYYVPFELIEFISPLGSGAVIRLTRKMEVKGKVLL